MRVRGVGVRNVRIIGIHTPEVYGATQCGGKDVGRAQVNLGQAKVYVYNHEPFRRTASYQRVQRNARYNGRGSWSTCW